ncbi:MAG: hypothetical protein JRI23_08470 [Deltaproteobacteria bacterium]|nr:hypothetical protein [Deltaproteobacteria bacterium]MBW2531648.1 hypothetical protein [Deltaproteobacteria bacterium]
MGSLASRLRRRRDGERRRPKTKGRPCCCCRESAPFCWSCVCGLCICQGCMDENRWGLTCNDITWQCPDCGKWHSYGNN